MGLLSQSQKDAFWNDGVLVVEDAVSDTQLEQLRSVFTGWVEESRSHTEDYGETLDGRARFDLQPGHSAERPGLRRIQSPEEVSDVYEGIMRAGRSVDFCTELIQRAMNVLHANHICTDEQSFKTCALTFAKLRLT